MVSYDVFRQSLQGAWLCGNALFFNMFVVENKTSLTLINGS